MGVLSQIVEVFGAALGTPPAYLNSAREDASLDQQRGARRHARASRLKPARVKDASAPHCKGSLWASEKARGFDGRVSQWTPLVVAGQPSSINSSNIFNQLQHFDRTGDHRVIEPRTSSVPAACHL
jgi:hypothetical protein